MHMLVSQLSGVSVKRTSRCCCFGPSVGVGLLFFVRILLRLKQIQFCPHTKPPLFFTFLLHASRKPWHTTTRPTLHIFQDLARLESTFNLALHQLFPPLPSLCVSIVCLFARLTPNLARRFADCPCACHCLSKAKRPLLCWRVFLSAFFLVLNKWRSFRSRFEVIIFFAKVIFCFLYTGN